MSITVTRATLALITDWGRSGHQHVGVPVSGAFHTERAAIAAALVGQDLASPLIEILVGPFEITANIPVLVAAHGGNPLARLNGVVTAVNQNVLLSPGDRFTVDRDPRTLPDGPIYLAVRGLTAPTMLGSAATDTLSGLGPTPIRTGEILSVTVEDRYARDEHLGRFTTLTSDIPIRNLRFIPGPHDTDQPALTGQDWTVEAAARSGIRLAGTPITGSTGTLPSLPVTPGTIQLPPSGQPIILGPDGGTTGGYPVVGVLATVDLPLLSRLTAGTQIRLVPVTADEARTLRDVRAAYLATKVLHSALLGV